MNDLLPISLVVPSEDFELKEILIRADIDKEVFATFDDETVRAIQDEVGLSAGLLPKLSDAIISEIKISEPVNIEKLEDIPKISDSGFGSYFADIYLRGAYKFEGGYVCFKTNDEKEREKLLSLEELSREFLIHPESIVKLRRSLGLIRNSDRIEQSLRHLGFAIGVLLGRFDAQTGVLVDLAEEKRKEKNLTKDESAPNPIQEGIFLTNLGDLRYSIDSPVKDVDDVIVQKIRDVLDYKLGKEKAKEVWEEMEIAFLKDCDPNKEAITWNTFLRDKFFDLHLKKYDNRPIYFPLSSSRRNFVFYFNIHTWHKGTFSYILSDYLNPELNGMNARLNNILEAKLKANAQEGRKLDRDIRKLQDLTRELEEFRNTLEIINTTGIDPNLLEAQVPYFMDLDDGVMVNSSALHPLLSPQWDKPKDIWKNIVKPEGKKDYDWSHLAMRYFPNRVLKKCKVDPSLAVAHSDYGQFKGRDLFKEFHPEASKKWEARNQKSNQEEGSSSTLPTLPGMTSSPKAKKSSSKSKPKSKK